MVLPWEQGEDVESYRINSLKFSGICNFDCSLFDLCSVDRRLQKLLKSPNLVILMNEGGVI